MYKIDKAVAVAVAHESEDNQMSVTRSTTQARADRSDWRAATMFLLLIALLADANASVDTVWVRTYDGPCHGTDGAQDIVLDPQGNVIVTYWSEKVEDYHDYVTAKFDSDGQCKWQVTYDGPGDSRSQPFAAGTDDAGNVYVTGASAEGGRYERDIVTVKYSRSGEERWVARYSGPGDYWDKPNDMAVDGGGNAYITGWEGVGQLRQYVTLKYDSTGQCKWVRHFQGSGGWDEAWALGIDSAGSVFVTGSSCYGSTEWDIVTVKYDNDGNERWVAHYPGPNPSRCYGTALAVDGQGGVYVAGRTSPAPVATAMTVVRYDSSAAVRWVEEYLGPESLGGSVEALTLDRSGNVIAAGIASRPRYQDADYATLKLDSLGNVLWVRLWGGVAAGTDRPIGVATDSLDNVYVTGTSYIGPSPYDRECATVCYDSAGDEQWVAHFAHEPYWEAAGYVVAAIGPSHVYVAGFVGESLTLNDGLLIRYTQTPGAIGEQEPTRLSGPPLPSVVRRTVTLGPNERVELIDISGRHIMSLVPGCNDLSGMVPGVYLLVEQPTDEKRFKTPRALKLVIAR